MVGRGLRLVLFTDPCHVRICRIQQLRIGMRLRGLQHGSVWLRRLWRDQLLRRLVVWQLRDLWTLRAEQLRIRLWDGLWLWLFRQLRHR